MLKINNNFKVLLAGRLLQIVITLCALRISTTILPQIELGFVYYIITVQSFFYKHRVNLTQPQLCLRFLLFINNRPIVLYCSPKKSEPQYAYKRYAYKKNA